MKHEKLNLNKKSLAFTLAEVLITLGLIGNVALLVLPGLITSTDAKIRQTQWKHSYALVGAAIQRMALDNGGSMPFNYNAMQASSGCVEAFSQYLKMDKICTTSATASECFDIASAGIGNYYTFAKLINGASLGFESGGVIWIDVNGKNKKPNKFGKDIFSIRFKLSNGHYWAYGAKTTDETDPSILSATCNPDGTTAEKLSCSAYYLLNEDQMK